MAISKSNPTRPAEASRQLTVCRPSFSADWGDYVAFAKHLRDRADADGSDLLLVDTGDRIEGNAIYDSSKPRGKFTYEIAKEQNIDLICSGNHELYKAESANGEFYYTVPDFKGNYLASNLDIINPKTGQRQPLAQRYKKFKTKNQGIRILAFGFIFNFKGNDNNTFVIPVEETVKQEWFTDALKDTDVDLILVYGHVDIRSTEYALLFKTIRSAHWDTPIQFFGGHSHIRDYKIFDSSSVALESGRYMETIGFMSIDGLRAGGSSSPSIPLEKKKPTFSRRYIDNNLFSMHHHSNKNNSNFATPHSLDVSSAINYARKSLGLGKQYGCAPQNYWVSRRPYPHPESIFTLLATQVLPQSVRPSKKDKKALVITNTGGIRFDIFKGPFTKDTKFLVSPFTSGIRYIEDVPYAAARKLLSLLNNDGPILAEMEKGNEYLQPPEHVAATYRPDIYAMADDVHAYAAVGQTPLKAGGEGDLFPGYTTRDDAGEDGDDTVHEAIPFYQVPNCVQAAVGFEDGAEPEVVDVMFNEFMLKWVLLGLEYLGEKYTVDDTHVYEGGKSFTDILTGWVEEHWGGEKGECQ